MDTQKLPKGIIKLPNGRYRAQIRRTGFKRFDVVSADLEFVKAEHAAELARQTGVSDGIGVTMSLRAASERYFDSPMFTSKKEKTRTEEKQNIVPVLEALGDHSLVYLDNNPSVITRYRDKRLKTVSKRTKRLVTGAKTRVELAALSSIFIWAVKDEKLFARNPLVGINRGKPSPPRNRRYEDGEETKLLLLSQNAKDPKVLTIALN